MTFVERLTYRSFVLASAALGGIAQAFATNATGQGLSSIPCIPGTPCSNVSNSTDVKNIIVKIIAFVLDFLGIVAVLFIIIAGIRLIVSQGEDEQKDKAKKTILYVIVGLLVIIFARIIVGFIVGSVPGFLGT